MKLSIILFLHREVNKYREILHACASKLMNRVSFRSILETLILDYQVQSNKESLMLVIKMSLTATYY